MPGAILELLADKKVLLRFLERASDAAWDRYIATSSAPQPGLHREVAKYGSELDFIAARAERGACYSALLYRDASLRTNPHPGEFLDCRLEVAQIFGTAERADLSVGPPGASHEVVTFH